MVNLDNKTPAAKTPVTSQGMWDLAYNDFVYAETMLEATRKDPQATPKDISRREWDVRARRAICNVLNFMITNSKDVDLFLASRQRRSA